MKWNEIKCNQNEIIVGTAAADLLTSTSDLEQGGVKFCLYPFCRTSPCMQIQSWLTVFIRVKGTGTVKSCPGPWWISGVETTSEPRSESSLQLFPLNLLHRFFLCTILSCGYSIDKTGCEYKGSWALQVDVIVQVEVATWATYNCTLNACRNTHWYQGHVLWISPCPHA